MATLLIVAAANGALTAGGVAAGTAMFAFGTAAATMVGTYIDQSFILPGLLNKDEKGNLGDIAIAPTQEGSPYQYGIGPQARVPGFLAWQKKELIVREQGGKAGPAPTSESYATHAFWLFARAPVGGINDIHMLWFDGKRVYDKIAEDVVLRGMNYSVEREYLPSQVGFWCRIESLDQAMPELTRLKTGGYVTIANMAEPGNNIVGARVLATGRLTDGRTWLRIINGTTTSSNGLPANAPGVPITFFQDLPPFNPGLAVGFGFRKGTYTQTVPALIEAEKGVGNVPSFLGFASCMVNELDLADYGNRVPNAEALVAFTDAMPIGEAITFICREYLEFADDYFDVTGVLSTEVVVGYAWTSPFDGVQVLQPLLIAYDIVVAEIDGKVTFQDRSTLESTQVDARDLGARQAGDEIQIPDAEVLDISQFKIPNKVQVLYVDPASDYQKGSATATRPDLADGEFVSMDLPLVLTKEKAREIAQRLLWLPEFNRQEVSVTLPPRYSSVVSEGSLLEFTALGQDWRIMATSVARGDDYRLEVTGVVEDAVIYEMPLLDTQFGGAADNVGTNLLPPDLIHYVLDMAPLDGSEALVPGYYVATCALDINASYAGAGLFQRLASEANHFQIDTFPLESILGRVTTLVPTGEPGYFNTDSWFEVELYHGELASLSEDYILRGFNMCMVGEELINFANAELSPTSLNPNVWRLSKLLRGAKDTGDQIDNHTVGERFVMIRAANFKKVDIEPATVGSTRFYKTVPTQGIEDNYPEEPHVVAGRTGSTWRPGQLRSTAAGQELIIQWTRRSRMTVPIFPSANPPLVEANVRYLILIYTGTTSTVARIINNWSQQEYIYTASMRAADGNTGISFTISIRQIGTINGRGNELVDILPKQA